MRESQEAAAITARGLGKRYRDQDVVVDVDLFVKRGEVYGLLGPNGAGKTTTVEMIAGLRRPTQGTVQVLGFDPMTRRDQFTEVVSVQPQSANLLPTLTVIETLELFASFYPHPRACEEVVELVGLEDVRQKRVKQLSGGQARRLLLGIAVIGRPQLVILDEPSAGLDPGARHHLWMMLRALRDEGVTVFLTTHHMDEAMELCDQLAIMVSGRIVAAGTPRQLVDEHSATSRVRFTVALGTNRDAILDAVGGSEIVITELTDALVVEVETSAPDALLRRLTFRRGLRATGIRIEDTTLEDVFLTLAGVTRGSWTNTTPELS